MNTIRPTPQSQGKAKKEQLIAQFEREAKIREQQRKRETVTRLAIEHTRKVAERYATPIHQPTISPIFF